MCYNLNTAIIPFCTVITTVAILTPASSRAWQHALINTFQCSISLDQPEYGCMTGAGSPVIIKQCKGGNVGVRKNDHTVNGVWRVRCIAIKMESSHWKEVQLNLQFPSVHCLAILYVLAKVFGGGKKNKLAGFSLGKVISYYAIFSYGPWIWEASQECWHRLTALGLSLLVSLFTLGWGIISDSFCSYTITPVGSSKWLSFLSESLNDSFNCFVQMYWFTQECNEWLF